MGTYKDKSAKGTFVEGAFHTMQLDNLVPGDTYGVSVSARSGGVSQVGESSMVVMSEFCLPEIPAFMPEMMDDLIGCYQNHFYLSLLCMLSSIHLPISSSTSFHIQQCMCMMSIL